MTDKNSALDASIKYFKGDELAASVFIGKYALRNGDDYLESTPDDMHKNRLAPEFSRIENKYKNPLSYDTIYSAIRDFGLIIPQGSPMSAIGNDYVVQSASNCFVISPAEDSMGGIHRTDEEQAQLMKRRGGVGHDISNIRPKGLPTANAAGSTDGIGVFMERFSNTTREVAQNGRRGALMITCSVHHPEIETFINIKKDKKKVTGANISVKLTDEFMNAVKNDTEYTQKWPVDSNSPVIIKKVRARDIWNEIISAAWESAEPGILFWDNAEKYTPSDIYKDFGFKSVSTNPCQPKWATVLTPNGIRTIGDINIGDLIWSETGWTTVINKWSTGIKQVKAFRTNAGVFYGTENHRLVSNGVKIEAKSCKNIDLLSYKNEDFIFKNSEDIIDGLVFGDGSVHKASKELVYLCIGENDKDYFDSEISSYITKHRPGIKKYAYEVNTSLVSDELPLTYDRIIPTRFVHGSKQKVAGFLRGLYSANGSICGNRVTLKTSSFKVVEDVQLMLSSIGIKSYYTTNKSKIISFNNGSYKCKDSYDVNISTDRDIFLNNVGFIQKYKNDKLLNIIKTINKPSHIKKTYEIVSIEDVSNEEVFDITVSNDTHTYWTGGLNVSNCGEIILSPYDSCRLITLNLYSFVDNKFTNSASFDYAKFGKYVKIAQRLMDDLLDIELEQINKIINKINSDPESVDIKSVELNLWKKIKHACETGRRTGLGITALGDAIAALNIRYGSDESIVTTEKIYKTLAIKAYESSIDLAEERGAFPIWNYDLEKDHPFIKRIISELSNEYQEKYKKFGRRNIALTTTAPTGSVSTLTQTTSGIEPAFMVKYSRRKKINSSDSDAKVDYVDSLGDKWQVFDVYHKGFQDWMNVTGKTYAEFEESPYYKATSNDVDWLASVKIQAVAQKWICHSISKTCNLPNSATKELVADVYMAAWEEGCKGFTIYRDGCRDGVLISSDKKEEVKKPDTVTDLLNWDRPEKLPCDIHHVNISGESWIIFVGKSLEGDPCELFGGLSSKIVLPKKIKSGYILKTKKKRGDVSIYDLTYGEDDDKAVIKDIGEIFANPTQGDFTRAFSLMLRARIPLHLIVNQMQKNEQSDMYSFSRVVARVLKKYIKEGTTIKQKCPNCGSESLVYIEGCLTCSSCGYSKCS